jgi:DNA-binding transcriptional MerR regulator
MRRKPIYSTAEVARIVGVHKVTLVRWLLAGRLKEPRRSSLGGQVLRLWSERDLARAKAFKNATYRLATVKGRGRPGPPA